MPCITCIILGMLTQHLMGEDPWQLYVCLCHLRLLSCAKTHFCSQFVAEVDARLARKLAASWLIWYELQVPQHAFWGCKMHLAASLACRQQWAKGTHAQVHLQATFIPLPSFWFSCLNQNPVNGTEVACALGMYVFFTLASSNICPILYNGHLFHVSC